MAYGVENQIGIGKAQVLAKPTDASEFVDRVTENKRYSDQQKIYRQREKERNDKELYGIIGDAFNPKNFNALIHDKLRTATNEMAAKLKASEMSYGDVYMEAHQKAGEIGMVSDKLNRIDSQLAATRGEYEKYDKRLNTPAIEFEARKKIVDSLRSGQPIDENLNYFDDALSSMGENSLVDKTGAPVIDLLPEENAPFGGGYTERNKVGRTKSFDWSSKAYPGFYDITQKDEFEDPIVKVKGVPSGIKDGDKDIPMLTEEGYGRFVTLPSNRKALDVAVAKKYGNINPNTQQAETLRRIEAYNYLDSKKPPVIKKEKDIQPAPPRITVNVSNGASGANLNNIYERIKQKGLQRFKDYKEGKYTDNSLEKSDLDGEELEAALKATNNKNLSPDDIKIIVEDNGRTGVYNKGTGARLVYIGQTGANLPEQANVKGKAASVSLGNENFKPVTSDKAKTVDLSQYDIPKGAKIKYSSDGKTPLGYELNGKKYKF